MKKIHYIYADGTRRIEAADSIPDDATCKQFLDGDHERVWVLFNGKRTCMLVNENGIARKLPVNIAATEIYRTLPRMKGMNVDGRSIHGNAIVLEGMT